MYYQIQFCEANELCNVIEDPGNLWKQHETVKQLNTSPRPSGCIRVVISDEIEVQELTMNCRLSLFIDNILKRCKGCAISNGHICCELGLVMVYCYGFLWLYSRQCLGT